MTLKCRNIPDASNYYKTYILHDGTVELDDNYGLIGIGSVKIKNVGFSESNIHIESEIDYSKDIKTPTKLIEAVTDINRYTGKFLTTENYLYKDGNQKKYVSSGECKKEGILKNF